MQNLPKICKVQNPSERFGFRILDFGCGGVRGYNRRPCSNGVTEFSPNPRGWISFLPHLKGKKVSVDLAEPGYAEGHSLVALGIGGHCTLQRRKKTKFEKKNGVPKSATKKPN